MGKRVLPALAALLALAGHPRAETPRLFAPGPPPAARVEAADFLQGAPEMKLAAATLQGLLNRGPAARAWLLLMPTDQFWLDRLSERGSVKSVEKVTADAFFAAHQGDFDGVVVYDPALPATINAAAMLASLNNSIAAAPGLAEKIAPGKPVEDLRGRWGSDGEVYEWAFETLWPRLDHTALACLYPDARMSGLRDFLTARRVFTFWVPNPGGRGADPRCRALMERVLAASPPNIPVLGFWYSGPDPGINEYDGVGIAGEYGKITVVSDWASNLSLLSGVPVDFAPLAKAHRERSTAPPPPLDPDRIYIGFNVVESGDAPSYLETRQTEVWADPARGTVPIGWGFGLGAAELMPPVAAYYLETATANDRLFAAISGAGYVHPYRRFMSRTAEPGAGWRGYVSLTATLMERLGFSELGVYTDAWKAYDRAVMDPVSRRFTEGIPGLRLLMPGMGRDDGVTADNSTYTLSGKGPVISHVLTRWPLDYASLDREARIEKLAGEIREQTPKTRPAFMQAMALSWAYGPSEIVETLHRLGPEYTAVSLPQFEALWRAHGGKQP